MSRLSAKQRHNRVLVLEETLKIVYEDEKNREKPFLCTNIEFATARLRLDMEERIAIKGWFDKQRPSETNHAKYYHEEFDCMRAWWCEDDYLIRRTFLRYLIRNLRNNDI